MKIKTEIKKLDSEEVQTALESGGYNEVDFFSSRFCGETSTGVLTADF